MIELSKKQVGYSRVGRITIGNNVFIGARSIVLSNVKIGDNSVVGANSVLQKMYLLVLLLLEIQQK